MREVAVALHDPEQHRTQRAAAAMSSTVWVPFTLATGPDGLEAVCATPAGGQATILPDGPTLTPP